MTRDPFKVHRELSCPTCHVKGQVVTNEADGVEFDQGCFADEPYVCCECGGSWLDAGTFVDDALKEYRVQWARIQEGRPYEPPKPKEPVKSKVDLSAFDKLLADAWRKDIEERASRPAFDLSKLKKSAHTWALSTDTWRMPDGAQPTTMPDTRETDEKIRRLVAEMHAKCVPAPSCIPVHPSQYEALGIMAPSPYYMSPPALPEGSELETVDVDEKSGIITYRYVKK